MQKKEHKAKRGMGAFLEGDIGVHKGNLMKKKRFAQARKKPFFITNNLAARGKEKKNSKKRLRKGKIYRCCA